MVRLLLAVTFVIVALISFIEHWGLKPDDPAALYHQIRGIGSVICAILLVISLQLEDRK